MAELTAVIHPTENRPRPAPQEERCAKRSCPEEDSAEVVDTTNKLYWPCDPVASLGPHLCVSAIFPLLSDCDLVSCSGVCRAWRSACDSDPLWATRAHAAFPDESLCPVKPQGTSWRQWYATLVTLNRRAEMVVDPSIGNDLEAHQGPGCTWVVSKPSGQWWVNSLTKVPMHAGRHKYTFVLHSHGNIAATKGYVGVGLAQSPMRLEREFLGQNCTGWSLCTAQGYKWDGDIFHSVIASEGIKYAKPKLLCEGATIEMIVDMEKRTASFVCSGHDCGVAFRDLPAPVYAAVSMFAPNSSVSVSYQFIGDCPLTQGDVC